MKTFQKANSGFKRLTDDNLLILAETVLSAMETNDSFPEPEPELSEIEQHLSDYTEKLAIARRKGSPYDTAEKNAARLPLEESLAELAFYVNKVAKGNLPILLSSGFEISRYRRRLMPPKRVHDVRAADSRKSGQMRLSFERQRGVRLYEYRLSDKTDESGEVIWNDVSGSTTSSRNNLIKGLSPGTTYHISVRAINSNGSGDWSEPIRWLVR